MADPTPENSELRTDAPSGGGPESLADSMMQSGDAAVTEIGSDLLSGALPVGSSAGLNEGVLRGAAAAADIDLSQLPPHTRSLLKIPVTVRVTLANQRRPVSEIVELGPGTLVKFEKTYEEPLQLSIGELTIAEGEAVKVGDKFGLRIGAIIRPHERFQSVG
jgi:flagellar motor switch/type III secretory pathway protein FliN